MLRWRSRPGEGRWAFGDPVEHTGDPGGQSTIAQPLDWLLGQVMGVPRRGSLRNRCIVDKAPLLAWECQGRLSRGPLRAT